MLTNTIVISLESLLLGFPVPILLALCINEVRSDRYKKMVQNITYAPHFLSTVVLVGLIRSFCNSDYGIVNIIIRSFGGEGYNWMQRPAFSGRYTSAPPSGKTPGGIPSFISPPSRAWIRSCTNPP